MTEQKFDPLKELATLRENLTRAVQQGIRNVLPSTFPAVDIYETDDEVVFQTQSLIGLITNSLSVTIEDNILTIKGEIAPSVNVPETAYLQRERVFGIFQRNLPIPRPTLATQAKSSLKMGVLTITLPKQKILNPIIAITPIQE